MNENPYLPFRVIKPEPMPDPLLDGNFAFRTVRPDPRQPPLYRKLITGNWIIDDLNPLATARALMREMRRQRWEEFCAEANDEHSD